MHCQYCGQSNTQQSNFCRFCGQKLTAMQNSVNADYNPAPQTATDNYETTQRRPYSWKTDEYQIPPDKSTKTKPLQRVQPLANFQPPPNAGMQAFQQPVMANRQFLCPRCHSTLAPRISRQISTAGWITFAVLLVTTFIFFWIGLLIKEDVYICPVCNFRYH